MFVSLGKCFKQEISLVIEQWIDMVHWFLTFSIPQSHEVRTLLCPSISTPWKDTSVYSGTPLFQHPEMRIPLYTVKPLYSNPWNEGTSVYSGTPLFQHPEMRIPGTPLFQLMNWGHLCNETPLFQEDTCIQWNSSIPTHETRTPVYSGASLFQLSETRTPLYVVKPLYSNETLLFQLLVT